jgi:hypothetical protein
VYFGRAAVRDERDAAESGHKSVECRRLGFLLVVWLSGADDGIRCARKGSLDPSVSQRSGSGFRPIRSGTDVKLEIIYTLDETHALLNNRRSHWEALGRWG